MAQAPVAAVSRRRSAPPPPASWRSARAARASRRPPRAPSPLLGEPRPPADLALAACWATPVPCRRWAAALGAAHAAAGPPPRRARAPPLPPLRPRHRPPRRPPPRRPSPPPRRPTAAAARRRRGPPSGPAGAAAAFLARVPEGRARLAPVGLSHVAEDLHVAGDLHAAHRAARRRAAAVGGAHRALGEGHEFQQDEGREAGEQHQRRGGEDVLDVAVVFGHQPGGERDDRDDHELRADHHDEQLAGAPQGARPARPDRGRQRHRHEQRDDVDRRVAHQQLDPDQEGGEGADDRREEGDEEGHRGSRRLSGERPARFGPPGTADFLAGAAARFAEAGDRRLEEVLAVVVAGAGDRVAEAVGGDQEQLHHRVGDAGRDEGERQVDQDDAGQQAGVSLRQSLQHRQQQHRQPHQGGDLRHFPVLGEEAFGRQLRRRRFLDRRHDLPDQPARAVGDPGGDLLEDPVADALQGVGDRGGDGSRDRAADRVAGIADRVAAADRAAGDRADAASDGMGRAAADVAGDVRLRRWRRRLGEQRRARQHRRHRDEAECPTEPAHSFPAPAPGRSRRSRRAAPASSPASASGRSPRFGDPPAPFHPDELRVGEAEVGGRFHRGRVAEQGEAPGEDAGAVGRRTRPGSRSGPPCRASATRGGRPRRSVPPRGAGAGRVGGQHRFRVVGRCHRFDPRPHHLPGAGSPGWRRPAGRRRQPVRPRPGCRGSRPGPRPATAPRQLWQVSRRGRCRWGRGTGPPAGRGGGWRDRLRADVVALSESRCGRAHHLTAVPEV